MISRDEVQCLAALARMKLTPEEAECACADLDAVLAYVRELDTVQLGDVVVPQYSTGEARDDRFSATVFGEDARRAFPRQRDGYCEVPRVFGEVASL